MKKLKLGFTTKIVITVCALVLAADVVLGITLIQHSRASMRMLLRERMLDVANTAAAMLDGDALAALTAEDADSAAYRQGIETLRVFQNNIDLDYIYCIKRQPDGSFVFSIDPSETEAGEFGAPAAFTEAREQASRGVPSVDDTPYEDEWGRFYGAYSPVRDASGRVAVIVAVDTSARWVEAQEDSRGRVVMTVSLLSLGLGALAVLLITAGLRRRFRLLNSEVTELADDVEKLLSEVRGPLEETVRHFPDEDADDEGRDQLGSIRKRVHSTQKELRQYMAHVRAQAYLDGMTGMANKSAYLETINRLDQEILEKRANFVVAVFDVNGLKGINDNFGHEAGDKAIINAACVIGSLFGKSSVYRIGGDEFIAVVDNMTLERVEYLFKLLDAAIKDFNRRHPKQPVPLAFSKGAADYRPGVDSDYRMVFRRADEAMYADKAAYYISHGDRRRHSSPSSPRPDAGGRNTTPAPQGGS